MTLPLICHRSSDDPVAYYKGQVIHAGQYLSDVMHLATQLPNGKHVLNITNNRYAFMVGLGASIFQNKISLLPSAVTSETIEQLGNFAPDFFVISDQPQPLGVAQCIDPTQYIGSNSSEFKVPNIGREQIIAHVFTSGSTGTPVPHPKRWDALVKNLDLMSRKLDLPQGCRIIGTTPSQHMYGFESNILISMLNGAVLWDKKPFFPADIVSALNVADSPVVLVTTPFHLQTLLNAEMELPQINRVICATAPLSMALAQQTEAVMGCQLTEIYGSTETGQLAVRRTALSEQWALINGVEITTKDNCYFASGGHLSSPTPLSDTLEVTENYTFRLLGRSSDMVNIAGKRTSLNYLNNVIKRVPQLDDAVFFIPSNQVGSQQRLALIYTSNSLDNQEIRKTLRRFIDPVFLPRFLIRTTEIPRNPTGKILQSSLDLIFNSARSKE